MIRKSTDNLETGIPVCGRVVNSIRYADDRAVVADRKGYNN